ncbi:pyruvate dehydrogenase complex dihydrolipoamide acetyltransferase [Subsaximicrobium wynnwilliamsii]|uniref:Acetyltransferase component of pyruvate dehydrogenase complex n=1 Tax=Subsaximicrobium wynnwilliamsii TaxID=291179 RepID=A0A5C6ZI11_9FLAO|nr:pyruvate dehydrogenase complex dihydrolipoamide acetyltransferase [Subsaximicrobium wynnwilliamsii]TXD82850.1 pyruvate dehydrogenase complex dihydrolipoamide acetyltransferase [Subsaximicrobium wynnwilliamsii]TXD88572.1 pyruvate dehydrogenase complex dihydrolipoamide acetyltransferase [Subsaximicrobium wynnwilliamsii]TXE02431.1 pyruvate dehydrogenase complex dihydrolipoamide acetyltransferase [Subsaximicrobium wynnwilliamsii]
MAEIINMPRLSDTMEEGTVASWLKKVGDKIEEGDILAEIETDKATMEFESFYEGTLLYIGVQEGETTKVDELLAIIGEEDEDISEYTNGSSKAKSEDKSDDDSDEDKEDKKKASDEDEDTSEEKNSEEKSEKAAKKDKAEASEDEDEDEAKDEAEDETSNEDASGDLPEGVTVVTMPRLSDTMEEGTVATWLKKKGDQVEEGDMLAEIETDKATMEFESFQEGTLLHIGLDEGETAKVDALLAIIGPEGTDVSNIIKNFKAGGDASAKEEKPKKESKEDSKKEEKKDDKKEEQKTDKKEEAPKQDTKKEEKPSSSSSTSSSSSSSDSSRVFVSPLAKKMAEEQNINLSQLKGSGENGRIVKRDIENYTPQAASAAASGEFVATGQEDYEEKNNSQMRKAIAKALTNSKFSAPHYYLNVEYDMENAIAFRAQFNSVPDVKISYNDMIVKACALALKKHPQVNSQWFADKMRLNHHVHIGVAVAVEDGLVVPVVKFANEQTLPQIGAAVKDYAGRARNKKLTPQEMEGSTFTVSNLGMFGIESFTSIINQPNSAILSVGAIVEKPVVKNGQVVVGNTMKLCLACDHRTVDGATGALFLETLKGYIENPITMLM